MFTWGLSGCIGGHHVARSNTFSEQLAIVSPHDESGGRFDGVRLSPGFGVLYRHGYSDETADWEACGGFFGSEPEHILEVSQSMAFKLVVQSDFDLVLGVIDPEGELTCWDDASISNANVSLSHRYEPGRYEVRVGSSLQQTTHSYRLVLSE
ncbi:MAG: hypothetical protein JW797_15500 [Bradymonadales bacterium]|nr:hypothetical protein [Bradymonadales bacterium]